MFRHYHYPIKVRTVASPISNAILSSNLIGLGIWINRIPDPDKFVNFKSI